MFWLQFAIACTAFEKYDLGDTYFANAYRLAEGAKRDPFQIDNHYAKFLLKSRIRRSDHYDDFYWAFDHSHTMSIAQFRARDEARFPLEVFGMYGEFMETVGRSIGRDDREKAIAQLSALNEELRVSRNVSIPAGLKRNALRSVDVAIKVLGGV